MKAKLLTSVAALLLVAACETAPTDGGNTTTTGDVSGIGSDNYDRALQAQLANEAGDRVFFGYDSSTLTSEGQATLQRQAQWLQSHSNVVATIEGHCDERGTREYNLALGERRANAAKRYLVSLGVPASRLNTVSYGKERPAVLGSDESAWSQNRRAVTVVMGGGATN